MMTEFRPSSFQILPTVIKNLIIINVVVFLAQILYDGTSGDLEPKTGLIMDTFALHSIESPLFKPWQLITHMFMHGGVVHILFNMFALWMFGSILENIWGPRRFLIFYLICGLGAAAFHLGSLSLEYHNMLHDFGLFKKSSTLNNFVELASNKVFQSGNEHEIYEIVRNWPQDPVIARSYSVERLDETVGIIQSITNIPTIGASGAVFGCLAAFGFLFPDRYIYLSFFIPIKAKWGVLIAIGIELIMALQNSSGGIARWAHLGGALVGFLLAYFWDKSKRRTYY